MKYENVNKETVAYMKTVENYIKSAQGYIPEEYEAPLQILADNYHLFQESTKELKKTGLWIKDSRGDTKKHPLFGIQQATSKTCLDLLRQFGLTAWSRVKMKQPEIKDEKDEFLELLNA